MHLAGTYSCCDTNLCNKPNAASQAMASLPVLLLALLVAVTLTML